MAAKAGKKQDENYTDIKKIIQSIMTFYYFEKKFGWQVPLIDRRWTMVVGKSAREKIQPINQTEQS